MIVNRSGLLFLIVWFCYISYIFLLPSYLINYKGLSGTVKKMFLSLCSEMLRISYDADFFYINEIKKSDDDKIDIIIANHVSTIDWQIILTFLNYCDNTNFIFVGKKGLMYFPGFGFNFMTDTHIKLARNWEEDKETLSRQIDKIDNGVIIIFPEGTRMEPEKHEKGQQFSLENNLPVYQNLLVPKSKGLWTIYNQLKQKNKMGKIYDMSIIMENFLGKSAYLTDLDKTPLKNVYLINRELEQPSKYVENADFKNWLLTEWKKKDNMIGMYQKMVYNKMVINADNFDILISLILVMLLTYNLKMKEFRYYLILCIILAYIITATKKF